MSLRNEKCSGEASPLFCICRIGDSFGLADYVRRHDVSAFRISEWIRDIHG